MMWCVQLQNAFLLTSIGTLLFPPTTYIVFHVSFSGLISSLIFVIAGGDSVVEQQFPECYKWGGHTVVSVEELRKVAFIEELRKGSSRL